MENFGIFLNIFLGERLLTGRGGFVYGSCMSKTITLDDEAYALLASLKTGPRDSFTQVVLRHVRKPADTCGELLEAFADYEPPEVKPEEIDRFLAQRGRRSKRP